MTVSDAGGYPYAPQMTIPSGGVLIGYARCSTDEQELTAQRLGEQDPDLESDHGLTGSAPKTSPGCADDSRAGRGRGPALGTYPGFPRCHQPQGRRRCSASAARGSGQGGDLGDGFGAGRT